MSEPSSRPLPDITPHSQPHWEGLTHERFLIQQCGQCGTLRHYPRPVCSACYAMDVSWLQASGKAHIHSWTVAHHAYHPAFKAEAPYALVTAELPEGVRMLARLHNPGNVTLRIGLPLRIGYERVSDGVVLPILIPE